MNTRYLISALGTALHAMAASLMASAEQCPVDISGATELPEGDAEGDGISAGVVTDATRDRAGLPWHPSLHASTKKFKTDGTWVNRKGVKDAERAAIESELRKTNPVPTAASTTPAVTGTPTMGGLKLPGLPSLSLVPATPYAELCAWIAANADKGGPLTTAWIEAQFAAQGGTLAALADPALGEHAKMWLASFKNALAAAS